MLGLRFRELEKAKSIPISCSVSHLFGYALVATNRQSGSVAPPRRSIVQIANPAVQFGLNWDAATVQGCVIYVRGLGSIGNETPDWLGEVGVRGRAWKLFFRCESYGLESDLARGNTLVAGMGFVL